MGYSSSLFNLQCLKSIFALLWVHYRLFRFPPARFLKVFLTFDLCMPLDTYGGKIAQCVSCYA